MLETQTLRRPSVKSWDRVSRPAWMAGTMCICTQLKTSFAWLAIHNKRMFALTIKTIV
jgi:hypothetical protein